MDIRSNLIGELLDQGYSRAEAEHEADIILAGPQERYEDLLTD